MAAFSIVPILTYQQQYYAEHREEKKSAARAWYHANKERCVKRSSLWRKNNLERANDNQRKNYWKNPMEKLECNRRYTARLKAEIIELYGGKCQWPDCGWVDPRALQLDHKNGVDPKDRGTALRCGANLYRAILKGHKNKEDFQLLCANHNAIKRMENQEHTNRMRKR